jgi:heptosyltransferase-2
MLVRGCALAAPRAKEPPVEPRSIFVLRNNDIGDLLVVTPLFEALKRRFPRAKIAAGAGSWNFDVIKNNPFVDEFLPVNAPWHNGRVRPQGVAASLRYIFRSGEAAALAERRFDIGIDVLGSPQGSLLLMRAGIPWRLGVRGYAGGHSAAQQCVQYDEHGHVGRAALRFAELLGAGELPENRPQLYPDQPPADEGHVIIAPGGGFAEKRWPAERFAALAGLLRGFPVVVVGGAADRAAGARIAQAGPHVEDRTGQLSLRGTFDSIAAARLVICNSSMAMHAAAAFRKPCVVVLGPWYSSASAHQAQWGHAETVMLGRDAGRGEIFTTEEVFAELRRRGLLHAAGASDSRQNSPIAP